MGTRPPFPPLQSNATHVQLIWSGRVMPLFSSPCRTGMKKKISPTTFRKSIRLAARARKNYDINNFAHCGFSSIHKPSGTANNLAFPTFRAFVTSSPSHRGSYGLSETQTSSLVTEAASARTRTPTTCNPHNSSHFSSHPPLYLFNRCSSSLLLCGYPHTSMSRVCQCRHLSTDPSQHHEKPHNNAPILCSLYTTPPPSSSSSFSSFSMKSPLFFVPSWKKSKNSGRRLPKRTSDFLLQPLRWFLLRELSTPLFPSTNKTSSLWTSFTSSHFFFSSCRLLSKLGTPYNDKYSNGQLYGESKWPHEVLFHDILSFASRNRDNNSSSSSSSSSSNTSPVRRPIGFENFYPEDRRPTSKGGGAQPKQRSTPSSSSSKKDEEEDITDSDEKYDRHRRDSSTSTAGSRAGVSSSSSSSLPPPPPPPPPGGLGAAQRQIIKIFCWAALWGFAIGTVLRGSQKQLSLQEFLSNYVARGLVERVEVLGDRGDCRAVVWETPAAAAAATGAATGGGGEATAAATGDGEGAGGARGGGGGINRRGWALLQQRSARHIVRFRTGMSPETFIEKMESFQASLGIHPRDYLPVYIEDQKEIRILDLLASAFFFLLLVNVARDLFFSRMRRGGGGAGGGLPPGAGGGGGLSGLNRLLGSSTSKRARVKAETVKVRFADVAGLVEAKREITEFVSFLKHPQSFQRLGAKLPKGALLVGPPGTGKTLLAKAVAGEAGVPFYSVSGSDFVEVFVGVGASRVRELFEEARKAAPSIIFIDEIDSVGGKRSTSFGNSEREQTLNQLLVEMDGFTPQTSVVVLAGTNREDLLDEALKRPGRFDRVVQLRRPDVNERKDIFKVHLLPLKLSPHLDPLALAERMAALTPGLVGADIANLCNEAAIQAARRRAKNGIEQIDFELAAERTIAGLPSAVKNLLSPFQRRAIAFHECGHCVAGWFLKHAEPVLKLTIIPRSSGALGFSQQMPPGVDLHQKDGLLDRIAVCLGGRAAEEIYVGSVSTGAGDDIQKASRLARLLVMQFGMSEALGLVNYALPQAATAAGQADSSFYRPYSEYTAQLIDEEVKRIIQHQYERVTELLRAKEKEMRDLCALLLEKESITYSDIRACIGPRPVAMDPQLAAYVEALPTTTTAAALLPGGTEAAAGENERTDDRSGQRKRNDNSDDEGSDNKKDGNGRNGGGGGGRGRPRSLDENDDASIPEKVRERVRSAAASARARRAPQQQPAAAEAPLASPSHPSANEASAATLGNNTNQRGGEDTSVVHLNPHCSAAGSVGNTQGEEAALAAEAKGSGRECSRDASEAPSVSGDACDTTTTATTTTATPSVSEDASNTTTTTRIATNTITSDGKNTVSTALAKQRDESCGDPPPRLSNTTSRCCSTMASSKSTSSRV